MSVNKAKKVDLRKLMKERRENANIKREKIDSPFAKYNNLGKLTCTICNVTIKENNLWSSHILGKVHKKSLQKLKKSSVDKECNSSSVANKRTLEPTEPPKKLKTEPTKSEDDSLFKKPMSTLATYSSSEDTDEEMDCDSEIANSKPTTSTSTLPLDFFDDKSSSTSNVPIDIQDKVKPSSNGEILPEGFFDDPIQDAKARNIEYKNPMDEEWEKFQKTIAEETNVSDIVIKEDLEESTRERDIGIIDEQIQMWKKVKNLQVLADEVKMKAPHKDTDMDYSSGGSSDLDEDDLLDWRTKSIKKS